MTKKYLAIITARGGSKRLPRKNILNFYNKPLIQWTIEAGKKSKHIDEVLVTSDDEEILCISKECGAKIIKRPKELAGDKSTSFDAIEHAIKNFDDYEYIVLLQPTTPLRNEIHIDQAITLLEEKNADAIISVCEVEHSPLWANTLSPSKSMKNFIKKELINVRSQDLDKFYRLNGGIYICKKDILLKQKTFFIDENIFAYEMEQENSIDIDTKLDFLIAETILRERINGI